MKPAEVNVVRRRRGRDLRTHLVRDERQFVELFGFGGHLQEGNVKTQEGKNDFKCG